MDYKYFLAVMKTGSLAAASARLHIAPSAISRQISLLEESIGVALFERRRRGMVLTAAGQALAEHALRVRLEEEAIVQSLRQNDYAQAHLIRVAATEGLARYFLPMVMAEFSNRTPLARFVLKVSSPNDCVDMVRNGEVDIGAIFSTAPVPDVEVNYSCRSPIFAVMQAQHPLATASKLSLNELQPYPIVMPGEELTQKQLFNHVCQMEKLVFNEVFTCNYSGVLHEFVRRTNAIALGASISHRSSLDHGLKIVPVRDSRLDRDLQILSMAKRVLPQSVSDFLKALIQDLKAA
ncbi:LysR family transcriptional regulator [Alcaligenes nematophilus]|uniref:LysR family transcriptional regulator n=3 Tax=Alcaligenes TaxID=507 RepID=A0AAE9KR62_ALCFA|nr:MULTISPECIES: LysR family transcriptional regulator [Alcaligenes]KVX05434.1 LysR family transcriptional regulator [Alcaligenes faecalis]MCB4321239.1 LysR family transcriptional regulator [Alcaligenes sp. 13f]MDT8504160.1 LysR family transcriptional regulator [Alcaligenes nematophilus]MDT8527106.1 LysR family transcriptional regulator [Alcaligenes nematophilus]UPL22910.1 LysR family transcriptional regulator [Alcaligenes faecalis]